MRRSLTALLDAPSPAGARRPGRRPSHPALEPDPARFEAAWAEFARADGGQLSVPPPALRGADAQAAAPGGDRRLHGGDARQREQPRARRRAGDERDGGRGRARGWRRCSASRTTRSATSPRAARSPTSRRCGWRASCTRARRSCYGANAHYTHSRMCAVLGVEALEAPADAHGRIDLDAVEALCATGDVGTVVRDRRARPARAPSTTSREARRRCASATACACTSTPPTAASSRCSRDELVAGRAPFLRDRRRRQRRRRPAQARPAALRLRRGAVPRPGVGRLYKHDSPYTYFTSGDLHLGEI